MVFFAHHLWYIGQLLQEHVSATTPSLHLDFDSAKITSAEPEAQAAGIRNGDTLFAIDGAPYRNFPQYVYARANTLIRAIFLPLPSVTITRTV